MPFNALKIRFLKASDDCSIFLHQVLQVLITLSEFEVVIVNY